MATTTDDDRLALAGEFPAADRERWLALVRETLDRGRAEPLDDEAAARLLARLAGRTYDGIAIEPLYVAGDGPPEETVGLPGAPPFTRGAGPRSGGWEVRQRVDVADDGAASAARALAELENGATGLVLGLRALERIDAGELERALEGVVLEAAPLALDAGPRAAEAAAALAGLLERRGAAPGELRATLGLDPIGEHAAAGGAGAVLEEALAEAAGLAAAWSASHPGVRAIAVDAGLYHDAGAAEAQELGCALATGVAYLRALTGAGLPIEAALGQLEFRFAASADQFLTIAKLRAARRLWDRVGEACGAAPADRAQRQHAVTSTAMMSRYDPWVNLLRGTVACFAAGAGGADAVTVHPYDLLAAGGPAELGRRLARNTQSLLIEESSLARVADPAGGSWYVEALTEELAGRAWAWLQEIERAGGIAAALGAGLVQERLAATREERAANLAHRRDVLTGVSEYPDIDEPVPGPLPAAPAPEGARFAPVARLRYAEPFERLRGRADRHAERAGERPAILLANLGRPADHIARATFARSLFEAGGIRALGNDGFADAAAAAAALRESGARLACICSSDALYAERAAETAVALRAAGAARVYLAGDPGERRGALEAAGVDELVGLGCDALAAIERALDAAGVAP